MYDMYAWDQPAGSADEHAAPASTATSQAVQAVQIALDRRDNGGDPGPGRKG